MSLFRDSLTWVDTAAVGYPALHQKIVELTMPMLVVKQLLPEVPLVAGKSFSVTKEKGSRSVGISEVSEGAEVPLDFTQLSYINVMPYKKGQRERISREMIEDLYIPVIEQQLRRLARRTAYQIDLDCMTCIAQAAASAGTATGKTLSTTGSEYSIANALGTKDILACKALIESYNAVADTIILNPINARDLYYLPQFSVYAEYGEPLVKNGLLGSVYNMRVFSTTVCSAGSAYILSTGQNYSAAYSPLGYFVIKRPLSTDVIPQKEFDSIDISLTTRYAPVVVCGEFVVKKTGLATS
jgi:hypothetical protein